MAKVLNITPTQKQGAYADIIAFLTAMAERYGSASQAAASILRETREYESWAKHQNHGKRKAG